MRLDSDSNNLGKLHIRISFSYPGVIREAEALTKSQSGTVEGWTCKLYGYICKCCSSEGQDFPSRRSAPAAGKFSKVSPMQVYQLWTVGGKFPQRKCYGSAPRGILACGRQGLQQNHTKQQTSHRGFIGKKNSRRVAASAQATENWANAWLEVEGLPHHLSWHECSTTSITNNIL